MELIPDHPNGYGTLIPDAVDHNCKPNNTIRDWTRLLGPAEWSTPVLDKTTPRINEEEKKMIQGEISIHFC